VSAVSHTDRAAKPSGAHSVGLLHLYQADTVSVYQRIRLFVCENSVKTADSDTYQEIPDTGHF